MFIKRKDFNFQLVYSDGSRKEVYPSDEEVQILPQKAEKEGKETVGFVFIKGSLADYPKAETIVQVVDVIDADRQEVKDVDFRLEAEDTLLTQTIEIGKEDGKWKSGRRSSVWYVCRQRDPECGTEKFSSGKANELWKHNQKVQEKEQVRK